MITTYRREDLHRIIDELDERILGKVYQMLNGFATGNRNLKKKDQWNSIRTKIESFTHLENNWDGYGAIPLSREVADVAQSFMQSLPDIYLDVLDPENISPTPYSTIMFDWENTDHYISLEIGEKEANFFAELPGGEKVESDNITMDKNIPPSAFIATMEKLYQDLRQ